MTDILTKKQRSYNMSNIRNKNTSPEIKLRKYLSLKNIRGYRIHAQLAGKPDIIFGKYKISIFVDGCFWHKCPLCYIEPRVREKFWKTKIGNNIKRDKRINKILKNSGWTILRFWEHDIKKDIDKCYIKIRKKLIKKGLKK